MQQDKTMADELVEVTAERDRLRAALNDILLLDGKWLSGRQKIDHAITLAKRALEQ